MPSESQVAKLAAERLADLLDVPPAEVHVSRELREPIADAVFRVGDLTFAVECKRSGAAAPVAVAAEQARRAASALESGAVPIVVVPFMGAVGRERCRQADVAWLDLCGNARIVTQGARILVEGRANRFKALGRPLEAAATKNDQERPVRRHWNRRAGHGRQRRGRLVAGTLVVKSQDREVADYLSSAVLEHLEVLASEIENRVPIRINHTDVHRDENHPAAELLTLSTWRRGYQTCDQQRGEQCGAQERPSRPGSLSGCSLPERRRRSSETFQ